MMMSTENKLPDQNGKYQDEEKAQGTVCLIKPGESLRPGMTCPRCHAGTIDYDGLLNLVCPNCGLTEAGAST